MNCILDARRFVLTLSYERLNRPVLQPQPDIDHEVRGPAGIVRGSGRRAGVRVDTLH